MYKTQCQHLSCNTVTGKQRENKFQMGYNNKNYKRESKKTLLAGVVKDGSREEKISWVKKKRLNSDS